MLSRVLIVGPKPVTFQNKLIPCYRRDHSTLPWGNIGFSITCRWKEKKVSYWPQGNLSCGNQWLGCKHQNFLPLSSVPLNCRCCICCNKMSDPHFPFIASLLFFPEIIWRSDKNVFARRKITRNYLEIWQQSGDLWEGTYLEIWQQQKSSRNYLEIWQKSGDLTITKSSRHYLKIWQKCIHSKSERVCGFWFSVSTNLRKECLNLNDKILRQKCVNQSKV